MAKKKKKTKKKRPIAAPETKETEAGNHVAKAKTKSGKDADRRKAHIDGIKKTLIPAILGIIAGFVCNYTLGESLILPWHFVMMLVLLTTYVIQRIIYPPLGIDVMELQGKDWLYVEFIAVDLWLVSWTLLLN